jgi:uncharacterized protein
MKQLTLTEIWTYPIKSLGGIRVDQAKVFQKGLQWDRRWMLIDKSSGFMTQRVFPKMALFKLERINDRLLIRYKEQSISISMEPVSEGNSFKAKIWDDVVDVMETNEDISEWFSENLEMNCRLVSFPEVNPRPVDPKYKVDNEHVSLADAYPFLIIGQSSLDDLNLRLQQPVPMNRFRPNFVFAGGEPYEEDQWHNFTIGGNRFVGVKPCARCVLTTVDQDTAEKGIEPLYTLSSYRKKENKVLFGQNLVAIDHGTVTVGDTITIL